MSKFSAISRTATMTAIKILDLNYKFGSATFKTTYIHTINESEPLVSFITPHHLFLSSQLMNLRDKIY